MGDFLDSLKDDCENSIKTKLCLLLANTDKAVQLLMGMISVFCSENQVTTQIMYFNVFLLIYLHLAGKIDEEAKKTGDWNNALISACKCAH